MQPGLQARVNTLLLVAIVMLISTSCTLQKQSSVTQEQATEKPLLSGLLDLNRYRNR